MKTIRTEHEMLVKTALKMRERAYCPYSGFAVGAALLAQNGEVFTGCNIENAAYPVGICAERTAFSKAVSEGVMQFSALAVIGAPAGKKNTEYCAPCGMCRQFIREFCPPDFPIILARTDEKGGILDAKILPLRELLPESFGPENLKSV